VNILLDTCTFLWITSGDSALSDNAKAMFVEPSNQVWLSVVSAWEVAVKCTLGKLTLPDTAERYLPDARARHLVPGENPDQV